MQTHPSPPIWLQACTTIAIGVGALFAALPSAPVQGPVAAVFPPWWDAGMIFDAASQSGLVLGFGAAPFVVLVAPNDARGQDTLRQAGAWLLPAGLFGCGPGGAASVAQERT